MKHILTLLFLCLLTSLSAQKLDGEWEMVARKGDTPCAVDIRIVFGDKGGPSTMVYGSTQEGCKASTVTFSNWTVEKQEIKRRSGKVDKVKIISYLNDGEVDAEMAILEFEGDFMLVMAEVFDGYDSTTNKKVIFRRVGK
jgi:hypothetical protein